MTSKERVLAAIRRQPVDRVPRFVWLGETVTRRLAEHYGVPEEDVTLAAGNDVLQTWLSINGQMERPAVQGERFVDEWGITWERSGYYNAVVVHPLAELEATEIAAYPFPDPLAPERFARLRYLLDTYGDTHFVGADVSGTLFEPAYHLRGMDNLLADMILESEECAVLLDRLCDFSTAVAVEAAKMGAHWIWLGDDLGTQQSMIMSPELWRNTLKWRLKKVIDAVRAVQPEAIIAYHSCGAIAPVIGDLVEIGVDVLNPLQESCENIDHTAIKQQYGDRITMMCGLDTQQFMPGATPDEMAAATVAKLQELGEKGGYIFAASHTIQPDVPLENILAMLQAADTCLR